MFDTSLHQIFLRTAENVDVAFGNVRDAQFIEEVAPGEGEEVIPTFYLQRKKDKPYHLDRCFVSPERIASFNVAANHDYWLSLSDHIPVEIVIKD